MNGLNIGKSILALIILGIIILFVYVIWAEHIEGLNINSKIKNCVTQTSVNKEGVEVLLILKQSSNVYNKVSLLLMSGFILFLIGSVFVLFGLEANYKLSGQHQDFKYHLQTTSPGLVLVTLGAILLCSINFKDYKTETEISRQSKFIDSLNINSNRLLLQLDAYESQLIEKGYLECEKEYLEKQKQQNNILPKEKIPNYKVLQASDSNKHAKVNSDHIDKQKDMKTSNELFAKQMEEAIKKNEEKIKQNRDTRQKTKIKIFDLFQQQTIPSFLNSINQANEPNISKRTKQEIL